MIDFRQHTLGNGLTVLTYPDQSTPLAAVNVLYKVGSKNDPRDKTGMAHLFEHMMFTGSKHAPDFDNVLQHASGENNAYTNADITNYYETLPVENIDTALWLESDRMCDLNLNRASFDTQQSVVIEEFKETCQNQPYGMVWHHLMEMTYAVHPYRWPTIGLDQEHISSIGLQDLNHFYRQFYSVDNAVLVIGGGIDHSAALDKATHWFGALTPTSSSELLAIPSEPEQSGHRHRTMEVDSAIHMIYLAFPMMDRLDPRYYHADLLSDIMGNGRASRLYHQLVHEQKLFISIDAFITGTMDDGLFIIEGRLAPDTSHDQAYAAIWDILQSLKSECISDAEMKKIYHQTISSMTFSNVGLLNNVMNLAYYTAIGDANLINTEASTYGQIVPADIQHIAQHLLVDKKCSRLDVVARGGHY